MKKEITKRIKHQFICPLFKIKVKLYLGDKNKFVDLIGEHESEKFCAITSSIDHGKGYLEYFVWIEKPTDYHSMVHETLHLTSRIFYTMGIPFDMKNDEMIAYYQNFWVRQFWNKMSNYI